MAEAELMPTQVQAVSTHYGSPNLRTAERVWLFAPAGRHDKSENLAPRAEGARLRVRCFATRRILHGGAARDPALARPVPKLLY